jgi:glyoxylate reductase
MKYSIYITSIIPLAAIEILNPIASIKQWDKASILPYNILKEEVKDIEGLFCLLTDRVDEVIIEAALTFKI